MRVLGIETTCDESAASVVASRDEGGGDILSNEIMSQIADHAAFGGVVPEIAARAHVEVIDRLVARALETAGLDLEDLDGIAAAAGPGLVGGVMVGLTTGKALALGAAQASRRGEPPRRPRPDGAADRQRALPLPAAARVGRPHPADRRAGHRRLSPPRHHRRRRRRRGLRQDREAARPAIPRRAVGRARRRDGRRLPASPCRGPCSGGRSPTSPSPA